MQKLIFILLFGFLSANMIAQTTTSSKSEDVKVEQTVKKCSSEEAKKCSSKEEKKCSSSDAKASSEKSKSCCKGEKATCSKEEVKETSAKKCSKGDACCTKTGKKVANCDNKKQGCCSSKQKPTS
ncbi:MAG: hypothetical protein ISR00_04285 [Flavobacteriales bacterium]|nr:hypothetical protein [Flavobacteriales bacterium]MBL6873155.1 hypothetical protein [Flavobacteriales bacterium]